MNTFEKTLIPQQVIIQNKLIYTGQAALYFKLHLCQHYSHVFLFAIGFASILCACAQPIMAYFRPHPDTSRRWVFDWLHWFVGNSAFLMAICTLFLAVDLGAAKLSGKNIEVALLIFVVVHVIVHLILTFQHCKVRKSDLFQT